MSTGKYVPPSRRPGYVPPTSSTLPPGRPALNQLSPADLSKHFTHPQLSTLTFFSYVLPPTDRASFNASLDVSAETAQGETQESKAVLPVHPLKTLVSYVCVFPKAHPAWESNGEIWTHTCAKDLIMDWDGERKNFGRPIPVFGPGRGRSLVSAGWWLLDRLEVVEPHSDALKRMLQAKEEAKAYGRGGRTFQAWDDSLKQTWVKLRFIRAPPSSPHYTELKDVMSLKGGIDGEVERYILKIGGSKGELDILESKEDERKSILTKAFPDWAP